MPDTALKELKSKRASCKGKLTTFEKYIEELRKEEGRLTKCQLYELKNRFNVISGKVFVDYDLIQTNIEVSTQLEDDPERTSTESRFYKVMALAQEMLETRQEDESETTVSVKFHDFVKLPKITLPTFDGDCNKWLEFRDSYVSVIHNNESLPPINKFQYLKGSLSGTAAAVIDLLELTGNNYEVAWKLICDRFDNKRQLVYTHLKSLFDVPAITKECDKSLRFLVDHISRGLRALNSLDEKTDNWDTIIIFMFTAKLDSITASKWEEYKNNLSEKLTLETFYDFLRKRADVIEMTVASSSDKNKKQNLPQAPSVRKNDNFQKTFVAASSEGHEKHHKCLFCSGEHLIYYCEKFKAMAPADRLSFIVKQRACINCLRSGHFAHQCKAVSCKICRRKHNSLLHLPKEQEKGEEKLKALSLSSCVSNQVLLSTALVTVSCNNSDKRHEARCLLDCGSQSSFISRELSDKLAIQAESMSSVCITGINDISFEALQRCSLKIHSRMNAFSTQVDAFIIDTVASELPSREVDVSTLNLPHNIVLADPDYHCPGKIDLLLGADVFWNLITEEKIKLGFGKPLLHNSLLGWLVAGPVMCCDKFDSANKYVCNFSHNIQNQLRKFWELEEVPACPVLSQEEEACEQHFMKHTRRLKDGRFCVTLPLKIEPDQLGDSYCIARKRFDSLERRFQRQPEVKAQYVDFLREYGDLGHLSQVERPDNAVFLPHHPVIKEQKESTKCRVVFDASAKTSTGLSLNDTMMVGPTVQDDIFSILTRLREFRYIVTGDIEKMYRQIMIEPNQRHLQMILWRERENEPIKYLQLNTITYGTSSAPFLSTRCLVQLALECNNPYIQQVMLHDFYIDDFISGFYDEDGLKNIYNRVTEILGSAGFNLRKVKSNSLSLLNEISNKCSDDNQDTLKISSATSTLGIEWDPNTDCILIPTSKATVHESEKITKRVVLSVSSCIFDPLGLLSVCTITCKIILQMLWLEKIGWDEVIPKNISDMWLKFICNLKCIEKLSIPRHAMCSDPVYKDLHTFTDASLKAYSACIYIRSVDALGNVTVRLLCAKAKVKPLKSSTIPRLELCGAVLGARLCRKVTESLRGAVTNMYFWCDSRVVLGWLSSPAHKLGTFVSHRVAEVSDLCAGIKWRYVPSSLNPADIASRGVYPDEVQSLSLWWEGPAFLKSTEDSWPDQTHGDTQTDLPELRVHVSCNQGMQQTSIIDFVRYSSFLKLKRVLAYVFRFIDNCTKNKNNKELGLLTVEELSKSEMHLAEMAQKESFSKYNNNFKSMPKMFNLTPSVDQSGLIRVGGRIDNSEYCYDKKHPIMLDAKHHFSKLIMEYYHRKLMHAGPQLLLSVVREFYWPIGGRILAKKVCNKCVICKRMKGVLATQIMGNLPSQRLNPGFPFEIAGTDYAGPFMIVNKKGRGAKLLKCYLCVFVCFKTKAVHLEVASDLSTEAFILALRRFMSRRGKPREIFCDNGTNFVGANRAICDLSSVSDIANDGIKFRFSPVYTPHFGGLYEAAVKSAKFHMKRVLGDTHLTFEELTTLFTQIEAILNSRPLVPMSPDPNDLCPLTPGHFLIGRPLTSLPAPDLLTVNPSRLHRYARIEQARQHFWSRWSREYICEMQQRTKWQNKQPNIAPDQMVLIKDDSSSPMKWPLGRVTAVHPGKDGACRIADIKTSKGVIRRAIHKLCPLLDME